MFRAVPLSITRILFTVHSVMVYVSDEQTTARGPDAARLEVLSGPRQVLK